MINEKLAGLAAKIVQSTSRERPADAALREELKAQHRLSAQDSVQVSSAVFCYFRWRGWLEADKPLQQRIGDACRFAADFLKCERNFSDAELCDKAVPRWLQSEMEVTAEWTRALQRQPYLWLRAQRGRGKAVAAALGHCRIFSKDQFADTLEYHGKQELFRTQEFHQGDFELQDLSSQAVGLICDPKPGETWWDACAGEGGKLLHLSGLMENKGLLVATDRALWRLQKLKRRAARAKVFNYRMQPWDGGSHLPNRMKFDGILVDAPCSGVGTWHRNPHARWTTETRDVIELAQLQKQLLANVAKAVKPGGRLYYAVCTLTRRETVQVAREFEQTFREFEPISLVNPFLPSAEPSWLRTFWPQEFGGNGMFVAGWRRRKICTSF